MLYKILYLKRQLVSSAIPPGRSLMVHENLTNLPSAAIPRSRQRPRIVVSMLPPQSAMTTLMKKIIKFWFKGLIFSEKYWYYFHCPKNVLWSILSFVFWIFPPLDTAVHLESADSKQNAISKNIFQDSFRHIFWAMRKMHHTFWKKATFMVLLS